MHVTRQRKQFGVCALFLVVLLFTFVGCKKGKGNGNSGSAFPAITVASTKTGTSQREVEIAPDKWVVLEREDREVKVDVDKYVSLNIPLGGDTGTTRLNIPWQGKNVVWEGVSVPFCLREWEGKLYLIGLDRSDSKKCRFRYYRQQDETFVDIEPGAFPKRIATQNMWLDAKAFSIDNNRRKIYELQLARMMDSKDTDFSDTLTAKVWRHLAKNRDYYELESDADKETVRWFQKTYEPIALPTIIKTPKDWPPATEPATDSGRQ